MRRVLVRTFFGKCIAGIEAACHNAATSGCVHIAPTGKSPVQEVRCEVRWSSVAFRRLSHGPRKTQEIESQVGPRRSSFMKPVAALLVVCLAGLVAGGVILAVPELSPAWSLGALALLSCALLASRGWRGRPPVKMPHRKRVIFEKVIRGNAAGLPEESRRPGGQHEMLLRIVDARGSRLGTPKPGSHRQSTKPKRSRI
jgi:hypothetical protein